LQNLFAGNEESKIRDLIIEDIQNLVDSLAKNDDPSFALLLQLSEIKTWLDDINKQTNTEKENIFMRSEYYSELKSLIGNDKDQLAQLDEIRLSIMKAVEEHIKELQKMVLPTTPKLSEVIETENKNQLPKVQAILSHVLDGLKMSIQNENLDINYKRKLVARIEAIAEMTQIISNVSTVSEIIVKIQGIKNDLKATLSNKDTLSNVLDADNHRVSLTM
jgi:hypothetical protein